VHSDADFCGGDITKSGRAASSVGRGDKSCLLTLSMCSSPCASPSTWPFLLLCRLSLLCHGHRMGMDNGAYATCTQSMLLPWGWAPLGRVLSQRVAPGTLVAP
jgi:hypothetical protein